MARIYELTLILSPEGDYESEKKREDMVKTLVGDGTTIESLVFLGKKTLSYPIKKQTEAVYILATIKGEALKATDLAKRSSLDKTILRIMLIAKSQKKIKAA